MRLKDAAAGIRYLIATMGWRRLGLQLAAIEMKKLGLSEVVLPDKWNELRWCEEVKMVPRC